MFLSFVYVAWFCFHTQAHCSSNETQAGPAPQTVSHFSVDLFQKFQPMSVYSDYQPISVSPYVEDLSLSFWNPWENYVESSKDTGYDDRSSHTPLWDYHGSEQQRRAFENDRRESGWQRYTVGYQDTQHNVMSSAETLHLQSHHSNQSAHDSASLQSPQYHSQQSYEQSLPHQSYQLSNIEHHHTEPHYHSESHYQSELQTHHQEPHNQTELHHHQSHYHHEPHRQAEPHILPEPHYQEPLYHHTPHNQTQQHHHHTSHHHPETYYEQKHHGEQHHHSDQREHHNHHESHTEQHYHWYDSSQHQHHNQHHQHEDDQRHHTQHEHRHTVYSTETHQVDAVSSAQWERQNQQYKHGDHADHQPHPVPTPPTSYISSTVSNTECIRVTNEPHSLVAQPVLEVESSKPADTDVSSAACDHTTNIFIIQPYRILTVVYDYSHY